MDPATHRRMRTAHLNHKTECPCGRTLWGNGWRSHARSCRDWLLTHGYPLSDGDRQGLRADLPLADVFEVQKRLGVMRASELPAAQWGWMEYRSCVRAVLAEMASP